MDNKQFKEQWVAIYPKIKQKWSKFTDQELKQINGEKATFLNHLQKKYGVEKNIAEQELDQLVQAGAPQGASSHTRTTSASLPRDKKRPNR